MVKVKLFLLEQVHQEPHGKMYGVELGISHFATTLSSSRWKNLEQIDAAGNWAAEQVPGTVYWGRNWRKGGLQQRRNELLKQYNFYNQQYCGCEYSITKK